MKLLRTVTAGLLAGLALFAPASSASAAGSAAASSCQVLPKSVTLYDQPRKVRFSLNTDFDAWQIQHNDLGIQISQSSSGRDWDHVLDAAFIHRSQVGAHALKFQLNTDDFSRMSSCVTTFAVLRGTALPLHAKKVTGGRQLSGTLKGVNFGWAPGPAVSDGRGKATWSGLKGQAVRIQYRAKGRWVTAATVRTGAGGAFKVTRKTGKHQWRAVYGGSATIGARTSKTVTG